MGTMDIYGFAHNDLEAARRAIETALSIRLETRDSTYTGNYFCGDVPSGPSVQVRRNVDPLFQLESDPARERFSHPWHAAYGVLVFVHGPAPESVAQCLQHDVPGLSFLERKETM